MKQETTKGAGEIPEIVAMRKAIRSLSLELHESVFYDIQEKFENLVSQFPQPQLVSGVRTKEEIVGAINELDFQIEEANHAKDVGETGDEERFSLNDFINDFEDRKKELQNQLTQFHPTQPVP